MDTLTRADLVRLAPERFRRQYSEYFGKRPMLTFLRGKPPEKVYEELKAASTTDEIDALLGPSWTRLTCDNCESQVELVVQMRTSSYDEYGPASYCIECLRGAVKAAKSAVAQRTS